MLVGVDDDRVAVALRDGDWVDLVFELAAADDPNIFCPSFGLQLVRLKVRDPSRCWYSCSPKA